MVGPHRPLRLYFARSIGTHIVELLSYLLAQLTNPSSVLYLGLNIKRVRGELGAVPPLKIFAPKGVFAHSSLLDNKRAGVRLPALLLFFLSSIVPR